MSDNSNNWRRKGENFSGLKWVGRRKDGVSEFRGTWRKGPPLLFCRLFGISGGASLAVGAVGLLVSLLVTGLKTAPPSAILLLVGIVNTSIGVLSNRQRQTFSSLQESEELAAGIGITPEELERFIEERDIKPKIYFNDKPLYHPDELVQAKILLRASVQPVSGETLLRAASPAPSTTETDQLLRASKGE